MIRVHEGGLTTRYMGPLLVLALLASATAQERPREDIFAGYSFTSAGFGAGEHFKLHGFALSSDLNLKDWLAISYKYDFHWGSALVPFCFSSSFTSCIVAGQSDTVHMNTVLGGLRVATTRGRATPFARALFGGGFFNVWLQPGCESEGGYAQDFSGGVQLRVTERRFGWQIEGGLLQAHFFGTWQNDFRLSTGPVFLFYKRR